MRVRLPRGRVIEGPLLAEFERERTRIEEILSRAPGLPRMVQTAN